MHHKIGQDAVAEARSWVDARMVKHRAEMTLIRQELLKCFRLDSSQDQGGGFLEAVGTAAW